MITLRVGTMPGLISTGPEEFQDEVCAHTLHPVSLHWNQGCVLPTSFPSQDEVSGADAVPFIFQEAFSLP